MGWKVDLERTRAEAVVIYTGFQGRRSGTGLSGSVPRPCLLEGQTGSTPVMVTPSLYPYHLATSGPWPSPRFPCGRMAALIWSHPSENIIVSSDIAVG